MTKHIIPLLAAAALCGCGKSPEMYVKQVTFPADADSITKIEMASRLVPSPKQLAWQDNELTAFLHFGVNTFTNREWGDGKEDPAIFNPEGLDAEQWVKTLHDAGFKLVILTAKHHDGFCLWPTATTPHSVANSPWLDGKGDVVKALRQACDKYGMKMGVYLSPWDRNAECYGDSPRYNDMFVAQLTELLSNYGKIDEVWFDGACGEGPNGKKQVYDWTRFKRVIEELQPDAVVAIMGDDVRWVGNEKGQGRETEWSATAITPGIYEYADSANKALGLFAKSPDLGGRAIVAKANQLYWWPSEVDVSIRPGWFFHETEQPKSLYDLARIYLTSVGRNSTLLLNIPPNRQGLINDNDVERIKELSQWINDNFNGKAIPGSPTTELPSHGVPAQGIAFDSPTPVNCVLLREDISKGQQVEQFKIMGLVNGDWTALVPGTTIGHKRILTFPETEVEAVAIVVNSARGAINLLPIEAYNITMPQRDAAAQTEYLPQSKWQAVDASSDPAKAFDSDGATYWRSAPGEKALTLDLGEKQKFSGIVYTPIDGDNINGTISHYTLQTSDNGKDWVTVIENDEFSNIENNPIPQVKTLDKPVSARYLKLTANQTLGDTPDIIVAELMLMP